MVMAVDPGGAYFGFYSDFDDVYRGEVISYEDAVASAAAAGARDVADIAIPSSGVDEPSGPHPQLIFFSQAASYIEVRTSYDNGFWEGSGWVPQPSFFLVEILGPEAHSFEIAPFGVPLGINHYVSSDGGQVIELSSTTDALLTALTRIKVWRAEIFPGDDPPSAFWTDFIGSREVP